LIIVRKGSDIIRKQKERLVDVRLSMLTFKEQPYTAGDSRKGTRFLQDSIFERKAEQP
jgi:hypothetical protein